MRENASFTRKLFLIYKIVRAPLGMSFAFVLMYGVFTGNLSSLLLLAAFGLFLTELFAAVYNDYCDYDEDIRNKRTDKIILAGLLSRKQMRNISFLIAGIALISLWFTTFFLFLLGIYCLIIYVFYSDPRIRLKGTLGGYSIAASMFFFFPFAIDLSFQQPFSMLTIIFGLFFYFQVLYILFQKDSTDLEDKTNLFISKGWRTATLSAVIIGVIASTFFLSIAAVSLILILVWMINLISKTLNLWKIWKRTITRDLRRRLILIEFVTPYLFVLGVLIGI